MPEESSGDARSPRTSIRAKVELSRIPDVGGRPCCALGTGCWGRGAKLLVQATGLAGYDEQERKAGVCERFHSTRLPRTRPAPERAVDALLAPDELGATTVLTASRGSDRRHTRHCAPERAHCALSNELRQLRKWRSAPFPHPSQTYSQTCLPRPQPCLHPSTSRAKGSHHSSVHLWLSLFPTSPRRPGPRHPTQITTTSATESTKVAFARHPNRDTSEPHPDESSRKGEPDRDCNIVQTSPRFEPSRILEPT